jgi:hypothetical protein
MIFDQKGIEKISSVLGVPAKNMGAYFRFVLTNPENNHRLSLEIYPKLQIGEKEGALVTVYTVNSHLQLHFCSGFVASESLGEVTFYSESRGKISGLIVDRSASCSLYANVDREILSGDFLRLTPEVMKSGIALSIAEQELKETS